MTTRMRTQNPEIVLRNGKPSAVILGINDYKEILERLDDVADLKVVGEIC